MGKTLEFTTMKCSLAFFVSPAGDIIKIEGCHIGYIIENPGLFDWTLKKIRKIYRKYAEPMRLEGKARHKILIQVIAKDWVLIRQYTEHLSITVHSLTKDTKARLKKWADSIAHNPSAPVKVLELKTDREHHLRLQDLMEE